MTGQSTWEWIATFWLGFLGSLYMIVVVILSIILCIPTLGLSIRWLEKWGFD